MISLRNDLDGRAKLHGAKFHGTTWRAAFIIARGWSLALGTILLVAVPTIRTNELSEISASKERVEDATFTTRTAGLVRSALHGRREVIVFTSSIQARLGREWRQLEPVNHDGHRLPNGLLAPMTC